MLKFILALLVSVNAFAAQPSAVPSVTVAANGANTASVSISPSMLSGAGINGIFSLYSGGPVSTNQFNPLYKNGVAYATTSSTKAYCFDMTASATNATVQIQWVSSQAPITANMAALGTAPVYQTGVASSYAVVLGAANAAPGIVPGVYTFGDGSHVTYAGFQGNFTSVFFIHMDCFEQ